MTDDVTDQFIKDKNLTAQQKQNLQMLVMEKRLKEKEQSEIKQLQQLSKNIIKDDLSQSQLEKLRWFVAREQERIERLQDEEEEEYSEPEPEHYTFQQKQEVMRNDLEVEADFARTFYQQPQIQQNYPRMEPVVEHTDQEQIEKLIAHQKCVYAKALKNQIDQSVLRQSAQQIQKDQQLLQNVFKPKEQLVMSPPSEPIPYQPKLDKILNQSKQTRLERSQELYNKYQMMWKSGYNRVPELEDSYGPPPVISEEQMQQMYEMQQMELLKQQEQQGKQQKQVDGDEYGEEEEDMELEVKDLK